MVDDAKNELNILSQKSGLVIILQHIRACVLIIISFNRAGIFK